MSPTDFYMLTIREAELIIKGYENEQKEQYNLNLYCFYNAIGLAFGGKKFKIKNPFKTKKGKKITKQEKEKELKRLKKTFEKFWGGDLNGN